MINKGDTFSFLAASTIHLLFCKLLGTLYIHWVIFIHSTIKGIEYLLQAYIENRNNIKCQATRFLTCEMPVEVPFEWKHPGSFCWLWENSFHILRSAAFSYQHRLPIWNQSNSISIRMQHDKRYLEFEILHIEENWCKRGIKETISTRK